MAGRTRCIDERKSHNAEPCPAPPLPHAQHYRQATNAGRLTVDASAGSVVVDRETTDGRQTVALTLPAVVTVDLRCAFPAFC